MRLATLHRRSLRHYWRAHLATMVGTAAACAVLTGGLLVGDSVRGSLTALAVSRLGRVDHALVGRRFFREALATDLADDPAPHGLAVSICPLITVEGAIWHADSGARVNRAGVLGVDERFWRLGDEGASALGDASSGRAVILNVPLADELDAGVGDDVLISVAAHEDVPAETLLGRRDPAVRKVRLTVADIVPAKGIGGFTLRPTQLATMNAFVPLATLQQTLDRRERVNGLLVDAGSGQSGPADAAALQALLDRHLQLADAGVRIDTVGDAGPVVLESDRLLIEPAIERAARAAAEAVGVRATGVLTYLANTLAREPQPTSPPAPGEGAEIPYSTVTAIDLDADDLDEPCTLVDGRSAPVLVDDEMLLNAWAAGELKAKEGDSVRMVYYMPGPRGELRTRSASFHVRGIVRMEGLAVDRSLAPTYPGLTDAPRMSDWDPPIPIDMTRIRDVDERYWERYGPAPKAVISPSAGQRLWIEHGDRFGRLTSIRMAASSGDVAELTSVIRQRLHGRDIGLAFEPVRATALAAARGNTDFAMLFVAFGSFVIVSAVMFAALMFRLNVEGRAAQVGILLAVGYRPRTIMRVLLAEGMYVAAIGSAVGAVAGLGYAEIMIAGLRSWWSAAVQAPFVDLHVRPASLIIGYVASVAVASGSLLWSVRGLVRETPRSLMTGAVFWAVPPRRQRRLAVVVLPGAMVLAAIVTALSVQAHVLPMVPAFFVAGAALLTAGLAGLAMRMGATARRPITGAGAWAIARLGIRNAGRHPRRTLVATGLMAAATFIIVVADANRREPPSSALGRHSGTGGFALVAESTVPLLHDLNTPEGRRELNVSAATTGLLADATVVPFRLRAGDDASCLNLYQARSPRLLGATDAMIERGGFAFQSTLAKTDEERRDPWRLLSRTFADGAVPAIADHDAAVWLLHVGLGDDVTITDERGGELRLRVVGLLAGSMLQGELIVAESRFVERFPLIEGYRFFLIGCPDADAKALRRGLEHDLSAFGMDVTASGRRLGRYRAVANAYLSAFQALGALGLVLGTFGLAAILLRNVLERRSELALLRAVGYGRGLIGWLVLAETAAVLLYGLAVGAVSALVAVTPHALSDGTGVPWGLVSATLLVVAVTGLLACTAAVVTSLRSPLLPALRSE